jgi:hypothetical protein
VLVVDKRHPVSSFDILWLTELDTEDCDRILEIKVDEVGLVSGEVAGICCRKDGTRIDDRERRFFAIFLSP